MTIKQDNSVLEAEPKTNAETQTLLRARMSTAELTAKLWQMDDEQLNIVSSFLLGHDGAGGQVEPGVLVELASIRENPLRARIIAAMLRELGGRESRQDLHANDADMLKRRLNRVLGRVA
jgi:hypothetical protein